MKIEFKTIEFKNVLSYGNRPTTFEFKNGIDLIVGDNGAGKSTLIDALTYALFGRPFRKIKLQNLINNKNHKELKVTLTFEIEGVEFKVTRGMKPDIFEIYVIKDGEEEMIKKHATTREYQKYFEENILRFNENVFRQLIALGANLSSSKAFMDLSKSEKEEVLQVITDTAVFSKIKENIREKKNYHKTLSTEYNYKNDMLQSSIFSLKQSIQAMEKQNAEFKENKEKIIAMYNKELTEVQEKLSKLPVILEKIEEAKEKLSEYDHKLRELSSQLDSWLEKESDIKAKSMRLQSNERNKIVCPSCGHEIKEDLPYTAEELKETLKDILKNKNIIEAKKEKLEDEASKYRVIVQRENEVLRKQRDYEADEERLKTLISDTEDWRESKIDYSELTKLEEDFEVNKSNLIDNEKKLRSLETLEEIISDKNLKGIILGQQLPFLNKYINYFLELFNSKFNFVIDNELKDKVIARNADADFNALSNGQKQRISLSILFAFLKMIEERNGISTNVILLDEYLDSSLDVNGIEEVLDILRDVFGETKDVILISHNQEIKGKLEYLNRVIRISEKNGFSKMEEESV